MANDGDAAVRRYFETPASRPDVLLIDIQMPGTSGLDAAREILATDPAARILFLTTFADQSYIAQAMGLGAKGYLIKQDVAAVGPALQAVMAGQVVLGAEVLGTLTDRTGRKFPVSCDKCHGVVTMYNAVPTWMADKPEALEHAAFWLLDCTCAENPFAILEAFRQSSAAPFPVTRGLYFRGVE